MTKKEVINYINKKYNNNDEILIGIFDKNDIREHEKDMGIRLKTDQRNEIIRRIEEYYSVKNGIDYNTVEYYIDQVLDGK